MINGNQYSEIKLIAEGGFGYVYEVENESQQKYAIKKMNFSVYKNKYIRTIIKKGI